MKKVLVIAPHFDDELFGCGGTLLDHKAKRDEIYFLWFTEADTERGKKAKEGAMKVIKHFKAEKRWAAYGLKDQQLDTYPLVTLISIVEDMMEKVQPDIVYFPFIGDLNKDHRLVSEATMVGCRPYKPFSPKQMLMYTIPGTTGLLLPFEADYKGKKRNTALIKQCYSGELVNGRAALEEEYFQEWPK